jgi:hypothetical protein
MSPNMLSKSLLLVAGALRSEAASRPLTRCYVASGCSS